MKISLYIKAPKCPKCKVPMKFEDRVYSKKQEKTIEEAHGVMMPKDRLYRCPKCLDLYRVEDEK